MKLVYLHKFSRCFILYLARAIVLSMELFQLVSSHIIKIYSNQFELIEDERDKLYEPNAYVKD